MTQPSLLDDCVRAEKPRRTRVRVTSKLAVTVKRDSGELQQRAGDICHWLAWMANCPGTVAPTTAELATWLSQQHRGGVSMPTTALGRFVRLDKTAQKNYIARGMWDAQQAEMVEAVPHGDRTCAVNKRKACTWRLRTV